jgi:UDP-3-O-[3-hydroxymyristoyl] glucosamine N-acyltransferase
MTTIAPTANVFENASVNDTAEVLDRSTVKGNARLWDGVCVCGYAVIEGHAVLTGEVVVSERAVVGGSASLDGFSQIKGDGNVQEVADYICVGPTTNENCRITAHRDSIIGIRVNCDELSFSLPDFETWAKQTFSHNQKTLKCFLLIVDLIKNHFDITEA